MQMDQNTQALKTLLRGEISAVETYRQAKQKFASEPGFGEIHAIEEQHEAAMRALQDMVPSYDGKVEDSGAWGTFAKAVTGMAKAGGYKATLKVLKEGEEHGVKVYESALNELDGSSREALQRFLMQQRQHIAVLDKHLSN